jgi:TrpR-related protein YerC/YecD
MVKHYSAKGDAFMAPFNTPAIDQLFAAILQLQNMEECHKFFEDICTIKEVQDMAQRLDAAILLDEGAGYQQISEQVGISTATISRVSRCLNYGAGGYRMVIDRMKEETK